MRSAARPNWMIGPMQRRSVVKIVMSPDSSAMAEPKRQQVENQEGSSLSSSQYTEPLLTLAKVYKRLSHLTELAE